MAKLSSTQVYGNLSVDGEITSPGLDLDRTHTCTATASATNVYVLTSKSGGFSLQEGASVKFKVPSDSTGACTADVDGTGAKSIKKSNGNDANNLKAGAMVTLVYNGSVFTLQGEGGSGNATAADILAGKTASTDAGDVTGTMIDRGTYQYAGGLGTGGDYYAFNNIPQGYYHKSSSNESWAPEIRLSKSNLASGLGITAAKIARNNTICGVTGTAYAIGSKVSESNLEYYIDGTPSHSWSYMGLYAQESTFGLNSMSKISCMYVDPKTSDAYFLFDGYAGSNYTERTFRLMRRDIYGHTIFNSHYSTDYSGSTLVASTIFVHNDEYIYACDGGCVMKFSKSGSLVWRQIITDSWGCILSTTLSPDGYLVVLTSGNIKMLNRSDGKVAYTTTTNSTESYPTGIVVTPDGYVYFAKGKPCTLRKFPVSSLKQSSISSYTWSTQLDTWTNSSNSNFLTDASSNIYVQTDDNLFKFNSSGTKLMNYDSADTGSGSYAFTIYPGGGEIYLAASQDYRNVQVLYDNAYKGKISGGDSSSAIKKLCVDINDSRLYVVRFNYKVDAYRISASVTRGYKILK